MKRIIILLVSVCAINFAAKAQTYNLNGSLTITDTTKTTDLQVKQDLIVKENSKLKGEVTIDDLKPAPDATCGRYMVFVDDNGRLQRTTYEVWLESIYPSCGDCIGGIPIWGHSGVPGELHVGSSCTEVRIGIGTSSPDRTLDVAGQGRFTGELGVGSLPHDDVRLFVKPNTADDVGVCLDASNQVAWKYGFKVLADNPNYKAFSINHAVTGEDNFLVMGNGEVWSTAVHVRLPVDFPDYVFEDDYDLMSLSDLQAYIKAHKRLPKMPSAEKVATDGLDLGETDRLLTEKVEELTLYLLQIKQEIDDLKKENQALKASMAK